MQPSFSIWCSPPANVALQSGDVHVWQAKLDQADALRSKSYSLLSCDEKERANRFQFDRDKNRFIACRAILRTILSRYSGVEPGSLQFIYGTYGKPELKNRNTDRTALRFSSSHSHNLSLFAVTLNQEIGIDTEYIRLVSNRDEIVDHYFTPREKIMYGRLAADAKEAAFFNGWTRKEAYLKATGVGLNQPLRTIEVSLEPGKLARLLRINGNPREAAAWSLYELSLGTDYAGAVAVKGSYDLRLWRWEQQVEN